MGAMTGYEPVVDFSMLVRRSGHAGCWEAFVDPKQIRQFWLAESTARLTVGATAHWVFKVKGSETDVEVVESDPGRLLLLRWDEGQLLRIEFDDRGDATLVRVYLDGFDSVRTLPARPSTPSRASLWCSLPSRSGSSTASTVS